MKCKHKKFRWLKVAFLDAVGDTREQYLGTWCRDCGAIRTSGRWISPRVAPAAPRPPMVQLAFPEPCRDLAPSVREICGYCDGDGLAAKVATDAGSESGT